MLDFVTSAGGGISGYSVGTRSAQQDCLHFQVRTGAVPFEVLGSADLLGPLGPCCLSP
jgi:hypothetical protein